MNSMTKFWLVLLLIFINEIVGVYAYLSPIAKKIASRHICTTDVNDPTFIAHEGGGGSGANGYISVS